MRFCGSRMALWFCLFGVVPVFGVAEGAIATGSVPGLVRAVVVAQAGSGSTTVQGQDAIAGLFERGVQQYRQGELKAALQTFEAVLARLEGRRLNATQQQQRAETLNQLGLVYEALGQYDRAIAMHERSLELQRQLGDRQGEGAALSNLGIVSARLSRYDQALAYYQQGLQLLRSVGDREGEAATLSAIGMAYRGMGQYAKALGFYQQALQIQREIQDARGEATALNNIGVSYTYLDDYPKALQAYQQALAIRHKIGDRRGEGLTLSNLGGVYDNQGQYAQGLTYYEQALAIRREVGDRAGEGVTLNSLAYTYDVLGQYQKSLELYQQALAIRREIGDRAGEGITLNNLGRLYSKQQQLTQALEMYQQALAIHEAIGNRATQGVTLNNIGEIYRMQQQIQQALQSYQQSLAIRREIGDRSGQGVALNNMGTAYLDSGQFPQALQAYQQALEIFQAIGDRPNEATTLGNIGVLYQQQRQYPQAEQALWGAVTALESLRPGLSDANKVSIFETQAGHYRLLQQVLIAQQKTEAALEVSERGRSRAFVELLAARLAKSAANALPNLPASQPPNLKQIQQIARQHRATLVEYSILSEAIAGKGRSQLQETQLLIWVVQPDGKVLFRQANLKPLWQQNLSAPKPLAQLADLVIAARGAIGVGGRGLTFVENTALIEQIAANTRDDSLNVQQLQQLHQVLIQPIADLLPTDPQAPVIFVPQGPLFLVPFAALQDSKGKYLIEQHTILTAPAIQVLDLTQQQRQKVQQAGAKQALVVGNPAMPSLPPSPGQPPQPLPSLPGAEQEAKAIATLLQTQAITGDQATKATVLPQLAQARIAHLATHGLLDDFTGLGVPGAIALAPSSGRLALAPTGSDNGLLSASEILQLQLQAELVVLSACDTGRGRITGDGVIGLSRSLISAGTPSVIVSLWQVPDAPTASLMTEFYKNWQSGAATNRQNKAQALRQAMLTTLEQYPDPRDWAGFTLIGEAE
ncbi:MAG TPA: tetratricopeptide repeat protein [Allocoleopsis sp.]